ncbi:uncharacterized protein LOC134455033 [Engraulis encrasicolus]|uniref:uncharacterized protein LOC134455033 n=1 Tax=Engraulis encrasicolus TaxID=184585 RepID=UPI002FD67962
MVEHNGKHRVVFNCSFQHKGLSLNEMLLPGPTLGPSLLGVLLRFRQHAIGTSGDIKGMFHQVRLLPEDRPLLRFVWRDGKTECPPTIYEWQVLPFGTTCSPCCATFALQRHMTDHCAVDEDVRLCVERDFYVDNCLHSAQTQGEAKHLIDKLRSVLSEGGFEIRQWASNVPSVIEHLPTEARSDKVELWLAKESMEVNESTLGLRWDCHTDILGYKHRPTKQEAPTLRHVYRVLASQYDPLGYILPFTTRAKVLVQRLWDKKRQWDDPLFPDELLQAWNKWVSELPSLSLIVLPRCYVPAEMDHPDVVRDLHVFCDASEQAYGSVSYLRSQDPEGRVTLSFLMARSRVAPKKQHSMPRLELCSAVVGAQLAKLLQEELTLPIRETVLWSDSTTVLTWLQSESCRFKVFVGTRVSEIQELTSLESWRYVDSVRNPADDLTRGKSLAELAAPNRWSQGPPFLLQPPEEWPVRPLSAAEEDTGELRKPTYCGLATVDSDVQVPDANQYKRWQDLLDATAQSLHGAANQDGAPSAECYRDAEKLLFRAVQLEHFPDEYRLLKAGKPVPSSSRLLTLAPEFDPEAELIRVGGRLRRAEGLEYSTMHPIVLDPKHPATQLLILDYDSRLRHPGPERVFAEMRRTVWILRAREAIRKQQFLCTECRRWKAKPAVPKMADLPAARLRLHKPPFHSTGMDCFGPFLVKVGRRNEKRWGIIFKCLTTRGVYLDILSSIDVDAFLMALRRFIARRGRPAELYSDQGTNFKGGEKELHKAFKDMSPDLQQTLARSQISFHFNPPAAPHFGGAWEREIRSVKTALYTTVGSQPVTEEVLRTVLAEVECILNSKPLGYVSSNVADPDPVTPNLLLMGRPDSALPQVVYPESEALSRRRWRQSQIITDHFWRSFIRHHLPTMQIRQKWHTSSTPLAAGQVVMMVDPQLPRAAWPIGRVVKVFAGQDGLIRTAEVMMNDRSFTRPVARLIVLPEVPDGQTDSVPPSS